jgi:2-methylcitrate dehydratase PrpD
MFPQNIPNRVTVRLITGHVLTEEVLDAPGGVRVPATDTQLEDKFHALLRPFASDAQRASILSHAWGIDKSPNLAPLFASMTLDAGTA